MKHVRKRLTYANVMSSLAVFLVLGGASAFAASKLRIGPNQIKPRAVKTGKIAKEAVAAGKIKKGAVIESRIATAAVSTSKIANDAVTGEKVNESSLGTVPRAENAERLGGKAPGAFESKGFTSGPLDTVGLTAATTTTVATLNLPAGSYLVIGSGVINSNSANPVAGVSCAVSAGGSTQANNFGTLNKLTEVGDRDSFSAPLIANLGAAGQATFTCSTPAGWTGNIVTPALSAILLQ